MKSSSTPHRKHVPLRTCIACRQIRGKRELVRSVRTPSDGLQVDPGGKLPGRGAYLCRARACWDQALASQRLGMALKTSLGPEDLAKLRAYAVSLPATLASDA